MCKTSSTPIINKGPGPIDNTIVNDQSTSLINFHEKYPIATMLLFGLLVLIVYFVHRKYCTKKAAAKPDDQPALTAPATMIPTAPMPPPSVLFPLQQHLNLQQPFHIQPPINYPWGYPQQTANNMLPLPALFPRQTPQFAPATRSQIRPANPTSADAQIERNNEEEPIGEATDGVAREFNKDIPYGQRYI